MAARSRPSCGEPSGLWAACPVPTSSGEWLRRTLLADPPACCVCATPLCCPARSRIAAAASTILVRCSLLGSLIRSWRSASPQPMSAVLAPAPQVLSAVQRGNQGLGLWLRPVLCRLLRKPGVLHLERSGCVPAGIGHVGAVAWLACRLQTAAACCICLQRKGAGSGARQQGLVHVLRTQLA